MKSDTAIRKFVAIAVAASTEMKTQLMQVENIGEKDKRIRKLSKRINKIAKTCPEYVEYYQDALAAVRMFYSEGA